MAPYHHQQQDYPKFLLDALYCSEEHWEEEQLFEDGETEQVVSGECGSTGTVINTTPPMLLEQDMFWDDDELKSLLSKEQDNPLCTCLEGNRELEFARREAAEWMMKVIGHYSFSTLTAVLAVNYLDRFLFSFSFQNEKPWMTQLAAVACISLAAKVEETYVPLLLDLQVEDSKYVFEAKTIKRMELLVLSTLGWKMNPPTPLSFIGYITRRLGLKDHLCFEFLRRCEGLLLSVIADSRFMSFLPSVMATATMMLVINSVEPHLGVEYQDQFLSILGSSKDKVDECMKLMLKVWSSGYDEQGRKQQCNNKRKFGFGSSSVPGSPNGVMDVSFSCDSSNDSWAVTASVSSSPEPLSKKAKTILNRPNADFISIIPR